MTIGSSMSSAITSSATRRALAATSFFLLCGAWFAATVSDRVRSAPLVAFYGILLVNTFFSIRCFASIPETGGWEQRAVDLALVVCYAGLAASFREEGRFMILATLLFASATLKYAMLLDRPPYPALLARKIRLDTLGTIACAGTLIAVLRGHAPEACWIFAGLNVVANVYVLWLRPLYRLDA